MENSEQSHAGSQTDWPIRIAGAVGAAVTGGLVILVMSLTDLHLFPLGLIVFLAAIAVGIVLGQEPVLGCSEGRRGANRQGT
jgi:hypothetical protein